MTAPAKGSGGLYRKVTLQQPMSGSDGGGGALDGFVDAFTCRAEYVHLRGGESVLASRLEGVHSQVIRVRASSETRAATTDWRIVDARDGTIYNIREISEDEMSRLWLDFLCQRGVAT